MNIGRLDRKVEILAFIWTKDEYGGQEGEWRVIDRRWAKIEPVSGTEFLTAQQPTAETTVKITMRYNPGLTVMHRIGYRDTIYEIIGIVDDKLDHRATVINCKEKVNHGLQCQTEESQSDCGGGK